jgi:drug/metabolite transporter (DMT)-like permease
MNVIDDPLPPASAQVEGVKRGPSFRSGLVALLLGATGIGFAPLFVRWSDVGASATGFWRLLLALPFFIGWAWWTREHGAARLRRAEWIFILLGGAFFAVDLAIWHSAIRLTSVANATLETNLSAVLVPLFAWLFLRQRIRGMFLLALVLAVTGVVLLVGQRAHLSATTMRGDELGLFSSLFYSGYLLSVKAARDRGSSTAAIMIVSGVMTAAGLFALAVAGHERIVPVTPQGWLVVAALAAVSQIGGQALITYGLVALPASFAAVSLLWQPAAAALAAWLLLGESLTPWQFAGAVILGGGLWLARRSS